MTTQDGGSIPLLYAHEQRGLRLVELPPELVESILSDHPPCLKLKSTPVSSQLNSFGELPQAVLCTADKTYQLRQVQTSNTVLVAELYSIGDGTHLPSEEILSAFATCSSTIEVQPYIASDAIKNKNASEWLKDLCSIYRLGANIARDPSSRNKLSIFSDIPYSDRECDFAWNAEVAFEHNGQALIPTSEVLSEMWTTVLESITAQGDDLCQLLHPASIKVCLEDLDIPEELAKAFLGWVFQIDREKLEDNIRVSLHKAATLNIVGKICVSRSLMEDHNVTSWQVQEMWQKLLLEPWRSEITTQHVMALQATMSTVPNKIQSGPLSEPENGAKKPSNSRNWHERLSSKRTKR